MSQTQSVFQGRKMIVILSAVIGIFSVSYFPSLPSGLTTFGVVALLSILLPVLFFIFRRYKLFVTIFFAVSVGLTYGIYYGYWIINSQLATELDGENFLITGTVVGLPYSNKKSQRFNLRIHTIEAIDKTIRSVPLSNMHDKKISLAWYSAYSKPSQIIPDIKTGDYWRLKVKLRRPRGFVNPAGFDYQLYLLQQRIMATGYVKNSEDNQRLYHQCQDAMIDCWRYQLREKYSRFDSAENQSTLGPLLGLLIGDRQFISAEQWQLLKDTGTVHLLAISGLHVGLAALIGGMVGKFLMRLWQLAFFRHGRWFSSVVSFLFALSYSLLAGLSLPTQRALIMIAIFHVAIIFCRQIGPWRLLGYALFGVALIDPLSIRAQGFWLSFLAVSALLFVFNGYISKNRKIKENNANLLLLSIHDIKVRSLGFLKAQWVIALGLLIPSVLLLQGTSLSAPIGNLLAVPLVSIVTVPLLLLSLITLLFSLDIAQFLYLYAAKSIEWLFVYLEWVESVLPGFWYFDFGELLLPNIFIASAGLVWLLLPRGIPIRWLGLICLLPLFLPIQERPPLRITFFDVGQGTAIAIETPNHQLVYDAGRQYSERFNVGQHIIAPYLLQQGNNSIDHLVISHSDGDHAGGVNGLLSLISAKELSSGEPTKTGGNQCQAGQRWQWDDIYFSVIWPTETFLKEAGPSINDNNYSCVLLIRYKGKTILLSGDIEKSVEKILLKKADFSKNISLLAVPHHGSQTSSHKSWVNHIQPRYAIFSAGYLNSYGHPHPNVVNRYQSVGTNMLFTAIDGAVTFSINNDEWEIKTWREYRRNYWYE